MSKVGIRYDERYQIFYVSAVPFADYVIKMTKKEYRRFFRASAEWEAVQAIVRERCGGSE